MTDDRGFIDDLKAGDLVRVARRSGDYRLRAPITRRWEGRMETRGWWCTHPTRGYNVPIALDEIQRLVEVEEPLIEEVS